MESLHQKQIENYNKNITQLMKELRINQLLNEEEKNKNKKEDKVEEKIIEELKEKEMQEIKYKCEELKIICENKEKIIKKLEEAQIEQINMKKEGNNIYDLIKENEELKEGLQSLTEGINVANKLYNQKLNFFEKEVIIKNGKLNEYKNKISILKKKINELYNELILIKGKGINNNRYYNANFFNNSIIINSNSASKNREKPINENLMINKIYSNSNTRLNTENYYNSKNKIIDFKTVMGSKNYKKRKNNNAIQKFNSMGNLNNQKIISLKKNTNMQSFINKNKEEIAKDINFLKEYTEILEKIKNFK
jgi:hypothetical protein